MSIIEDLGGQIRATSEDLPVAQILQALEKLGLAAERLRWVRQESNNPMGVPELSAATEHAESAGHALRVAQEQLTSYLAAIGLAPDRARQPVTDQRDPKHDAPRPDAPPENAADDEPRDTPPLRRWWSVRVAELTGHAEGAPTAPDEQITDAAELLRRVADGVRSGDRDRLHRELTRAHADVGLGLAALTPPLLRDLATQLIGHPPRAQDLDRLRRDVDSGVRDLLPGLPRPALDTLLTRVCRMPPPKQPTEAAEQAHPADAAVTAGVLTGLLLHRLGRDLPQRQDSDG